MKEPHTDALRKTTPIYRQVAGQIERNILSGALKAGDQIPATPAICQEFGIAINTAQQALTLLMKRGLLERIPGRGTFVSPRTACRTVGVLCGRNMFADPNQMFVQYLLKTLMEQGRQQGWEIKLYAPSSEQPEVVLQTIRDVERDYEACRIRAVLTLNNTPEITDWVDNASSPVPRVHYRAGAEYRAVGRFGMDYLTECRCARVAVVPLPQLPDGIWKDFHDGVEEGLAAGREAGIRAQAVWLRPTTLERDAFAIVGDALRSDPAIDGILVSTDSACRGVLYAMQAAGLRFPGPVRLVSHANSRIPIHFPIDVTRLEFDTDARALEALRQVQVLMDGTEFMPEKCQPTFIRGET